MIYVSIVVVLYKLLFCNALHNHCCCCYHRHCVRHQARKYCQNCGSSLLSICIAAGWRDDCRVLVDLRRRNLVCTLPAPSAHTPAPHAPPQAHQQPVCQQLIAIKVLRHTWRLPRLHARACAMGASAPPNVWLVVGRGVAAR